VAKPTPYYDVSLFLKACGKCAKGTGIVKLERFVMQSAASDFGIMNKHDLFEFIASGGLEDLSFINSKEYRISSEIPLPVCDAYQFTSGFTIGYIAFFHSNVHATWVIKSFHRSRDEGKTTMALAIEKAGLALLEIL
jgi:hypothetical protein